MQSSLSCIIQCLERTISPDKEILAESQLVLEKCIQENVGQFILNMSAILVDQTKSPVARQAAGLQLKNCLTVKDVSLKEEYQRRWSNLPEETRKAVRERLITTLGTENIYPSCAAQCISYIAAAELCLDIQSSSEINSLKNLISELSGIACRPTNERRKEAILDSISYICQEISPLILANFYKLILDPILFCMEDNKSTKRIRLAASRALLSSLECIHPSFETEEGRDVIMQVVCDATQSSAVEESVIWLEILAKISTFYYQYLMKYMDSAIIPITVNAIESADSNISLQGIEFWSSLAEIEFDLASGVYLQYDPTLEVASSCYVEKTLPMLVPVLMSAITAWQDGPNDLEDLEDWTPFKGACSCLMLLAQCCPSTIDIYVTPQVCSFIKCSNWRNHHAALWAIASILGEMDQNRAFSEILPFMAPFWEFTRDGKSAKVRYAAHMLMNQIFEACPSLIPKVVRPLIKGLLENFNDDDHRVVAAACKSLSSLVKVIYKLTSETKKDSALPITASFSRYYKKMIEKLLKCGESFPEDFKLVAHQALVDVLLSAPEDCYGFAKNTIKTLIGKLRDEAEDERTENDFICVTLSRAMSKLKADEIHIRHEFMRVLLSLLHSGIIKEDVLMATSTTISLLSLAELKVHLPSLITYFKSAVELPDVCPMVVSLIGDLFRAIPCTESLEYLDCFVPALFNLLTLKEVPTKLRSECIATLMDAANSVGMQHFRPYISCTLNQLQYSSSITVKKDLEHEELQQNMLQLYTGLFPYICDQKVSDHQSSKNKDQKFTSPLSLMEKCLAGLSNLIAAVVDEDSSDIIILASAELVGIIFEKLGPAKATKYLKGNVNLKWLLNAAADRADSCEPNNYYMRHEYDRKCIILSALEALNAVE